MSIRHLTKKSRKQKGPKKPMQQAPQQPQLTQEQQAFIQLNQSLNQVRGAIAQQRVAHANSYLTLASTIARELFVSKVQDRTMSLSMDLAERGIQVEAAIYESIDLAFDFISTFRDRSLTEDLKMRETAPVDPLLLQDEVGLQAEIQKLEAFFQDLMAKEQNRADANKFATEASNIVNLIQPTEHEDLTSPEAV